MTESHMSSTEWWNANRIWYNLGLIIAGILSFIAYAVVGFTASPPIPDFEITIITIMGGGIIYLVMMLIANICYYIGPLSEFIVRPRNATKYRRICFWLGFVPSMLIPFTPALLLAIERTIHQQ